MNKEKQKALEAAGWVFEDAEDFLELTVEERAIVALCVNLARRIRLEREKQELTQAELAKRMNTSQPRVNKIEAGAGGVSLEQLLSGWYALGGAVEMKLIERSKIRPAAQSVVDYGGRPQIEKVKKSVPAKKTPAKKSGARQRGAVRQRERVANATGGAAGGWRSQLGRRFACRLRSGPRL